jgi:RHS repeat-associated protein
MLNNPYWMPYNAPLELLNGGWYVALSGAWLATQSPDYPACQFDQEIWAPNGVAHWFHVNLGPTPQTLTSGCSIQSTSTYAIDSSGFELFATYSKPNVTFTLYAPDGTLVMVQTPGGSNPQWPKDSNGNYMSVGGPGLSGSGTDTLGRQFLQLPISPSTCLFTSQHGGGQLYACYNVLNSQGTQATMSQYTLSFADIPLKTNFGWNGIAECTTSCWTTVLTGITLPDTTSYSFKYDCDSTTGIAACNAPGSQSGYYGTLTQMTMPSGEQITYGYSMFGGVPLGNNQNQFPNWWITQKSSSQGTWTYTPTATAGAGTNNDCLPGYYVGCMQTVVHRPDGSQEATSFIVDPLGGAYPQIIYSYDTDGATLLSTVTNTWDFSQTCTLTFCADAKTFNSDEVGYQDVRRLSTQITVPIPGGNLTKQTTYAYDTPQTGNLTAIKEWRYLSGTSPSFPSVPDRATYVTYATIGTNNDINQPLSVTVCNNSGTDPNCPGGGTTVARATVTYDVYTGSGGTCPSPSTGLKSVTGVVNHDDTNYGCSYTARGNPTSISQWVSGSATLTTSFTYDTTGQVVTKTDSAGNVTYYYYAPDNFYNDNGSDPPNKFSPSTPTNAYVVKVTDNIGSTYMGYYYGSGKVALSTDYDLVTSYSHYVDPFDRPTETDYPIGWVLNQYHIPVSGQTEVDSYAPVGYTGTASASCSNCTHSQSMLDALGRATTDSLVNNPAGQVYVNYAYDGLNRIVSTSHPNFGSSDPNDVVERQGFDGLNRALFVAHPDGQFSRAAYGANVGNLGGLTTQQSTSVGYGYPIVSVDEAGYKRQEWIDGFGKVIEVDEASAMAGTLGTGSVTILGTEQSVQIYTCQVLQANPNLSGGCYKTKWDFGTVSIAVNGFVASTGYAQGSTDANIASSLASVFNGNSNSPVTATASNGTVFLTSKTTGAASDYPLSATSMTKDPTDFGSPSFSASPSGSTLTGGYDSVPTLQSPTSTFYTYDALGNLTGVAQGGQTRSWTYDGLSRLTKEVTPEAGTVTLSYVNSGGTPCSGNPSNPCSRTAPAPNQTGATTVTTTYSYDNANRLTQKTYSDNSATVTYAYQTTAYGVGLLATMTDPSGSESYTYDQMKRVTQIAKKIGTTTYTAQYGYNTVGQLTQITYPSGRVVYYNYDNVGHLCQVATTTAANGSCNAGTAYLTLQSTQYDAASRPLSATYGNGVIATAAYAPNTFELTSLKYVKGSTTYLGLNYYYQQDSTNCSTGNAVGNHGQIQCIADVSSGTGDSGRSVAYTYDQLGRLLTAVTTGSTQYPAWGLSETYDRYANRTAQGVTKGTGYGGTWSVNSANNQITSFSYDAVGNLISLPSPTETFTYDHEQCNTGYTGGGSTATYTCDGNELRVQKVVTGTDAVNTIYVRSGGLVLAEYDNGAVVASPTREFLYGNNLLAIVTGSSGGSGGTIIYQHRDHLSPRIYTDVNGNCVGDQGTYPYGELWYQNTDTGCSTTTASSFLFTTYERDAESGNDYALARSYAGTQGRFLSPDPLEGIVGDPQSWNRYAYVENDPINLTDPSGQNFWVDLGIAVVTVFVDLNCWQCIPAMTALDEAAAAEQGAESITNWIQIAPTTLGKFANTTLFMAAGTGTDCAGSDCVASGAPGAGGRSAYDASSTGNNPEGNIGSGGGDPGSQGPGTGGAGAGTGAGAGGSGGGPGTISNPTGASIWDECGKGCYGALSWAANFSAGAGEFLTAGLTSWINRKTGAASVVNTNSGAYRAGWWTGLGLTVATSAASSVTAQAVNGGKQGIIYGRGGLPGLSRGGEALLNSGKVRFGWYWTGTRDAVGLRIGEVGDLIHWHIPFWHP